MQRNILKIALICGIALLLASTPINGLYAAQDTVETSLNLDENVSGTYYVNAQHGLKMRSAPSTNADVIALLPYKAEITVTGATDNNWYKAEYSNQSGYVAADYVTKSATSDTDTETADTTPAETQEAPADTFGATSIITALIVAIIIMILLALYTAYSFLKKGNDNATEEYDSEYDDDDEEYNDEYGEDDEEYDEEYDDDEDDE